MVAETCMLSYPASKQVMMLHRYFIIQYATIFILFTTRVQAVIQSKVV